ncbi:MAG: hypothetical protein ACOCX2_15400, partial [Armatimonadota bacterium]
MYVRTKTVKRGGRTYLYHSICESIREGRRVHQRTLVELGGLDDATAGEVSRLCEAAGGGDACSRVHRRPIGGPLLLDALLRTTGVDALLRRIGRCAQGRPLAPALRLLIAGRCFGASSTAEVARDQEGLLGARAPDEPVSYDLLLRALSRLGDAADEVESHLSEVTDARKIITTHIAEDFCPDYPGRCPPLTVGASADDLLPLCIHANCPLPDAPDIIACGGNGPDEYETNG